MRDEERERERERERETRERKKVVLIYLCMKETEGGIIRFDGLTTSH